MQTDTQRQMNAHLTSIYNGNKNRSKTQNRLKRTLFNRTKHANLQESPLLPSYVQHKTQNQTIHLAYVSLMLAEGKRHETDVIKRKETKPKKQTIKNTQKTKCFLQAVVTWKMDQRHQNWYEQVQKHVPANGPKHLALPTSSFSLKAEQYSSLKKQVSYQHGSVKLWCELLKCL